MGGGGGKVKENRTWGVGMAAGAIRRRALEPERESFAEAASRLRARTPPQATDSADIIRQDRERLS